MSTSHPSIIADAIKKLGFEALNPMQEEMLRVGKQSREILLLSPTGSGKTVAFLLPLLQQIATCRGETKALIIVPTRELALQIEQVFKTMATGLKVSTCYGGHHLKTEKNNLQEAPVLLIGTPGRLLHHLEKNNFDPSRIEILLLDEYDKSFEFGFEREISAILRQLPQPRQLILTSATKLQQMPDFVHFKHPVILDYTNEAKPAGLQINLIRADGKDKLSLLMSLLACLNDGLTLVFCNHREAVERISDLLFENSIAHDTYHGGHEQSQRERALIKFSNGSNPVLITTDLASRGLDISGIRNIIHYQAATSESVFIHRNGRTARMDQKGTVWLLLTEEELVPNYVGEFKTITELPSPRKDGFTPYFTTIYFGAGKKDKISKADLVGVLIQKCGLKKEQIGMINVLDYESYAAVPQAQINQIIAVLNKEKIKNKKVKIARSN